MPEQIQSTVSERVREILGEEVLTENMVLSYEWNHGYEKLSVQRDGGGTLEFAGSFHPEDGSCVGSGVCIYCGRTLYESDQSEGIGGEW